ncbi:hypothetical protein CHISP_2320 [Chitinispirillum alkaliphilum]|nr:hypothetical protein CHISP_2320 [Chitinispirillum alkaliphilum]
MIIREVEEAHVIANDALLQLFQESENSPFDNETNEEMDPVVVNNITFTPSYIIEEEDFVKRAVVTVRWRKMGNDHEVTLLGVVR